MLLGSSSAAAGEGANTVLAGIMRGCGRQKIGATINLITYWVFGLPLACALAFWGKLGAVGLWIGLACTASIQAFLMTLTVYRWVNRVGKCPGGVWYGVVAGRGGVGCDRPCSLLLCGIMGRLLGMLLAVPLDWTGMDC